MKPVRSPLLGHAVDAGPLAAVGLRALLRLRPVCSGLALRIVAVGVGRHDARMVAGAGHALAILLFAGVMLRAVSAGLHRKEMPA